MDYHAYRIDADDGSRVVNPKFDADCKRLLDLKSVAERGHPYAVAHFSKMAKEFLASKGIPPPDLQVHIVVVPSSTAGKWSPGLLKIGEYLIKHNSNFVDSMQSLVRVKTIQKLARGGDRSVWTHSQSIALAPKADKILARKTILLLDDITTTGNSMSACAEILTVQATPARVMPLAIGKTV
ncbi:hypothetical protein [Paraburkholderia caribensis]|uniref:hypothetical protein n=1 Tax=Paraburkholderia caribensis TaxID=75105 RepID=UPI00285D1427|nr:hypothetical protein [Paraburkholderia caribensis]MDR6383987.1 putative amidophosphoribosyltransferase [Paraburkholderia caribensis]